MLLLGALFMIQLFVGIIVDQYNSEMELVGGNAFLTPEQQDWLNVKKFLITQKPIKRVGKPKNSCKAVIWEIVHGKFALIFEVFIMVCILANTTMMAMRYFNSPGGYNLLLDNFNLIFTAVFTVECILKLIALEKDYFKENWNRFDFIIVIGAVIGVFIK